MGRASGAGTGAFQDAKPRGGAAEAAQVSADGAPYMPHPYPLKHLGRHLPGTGREVRNPVVKPAAGRPYRSYGAWFQAHQHPEHDVVLGEVVEVSLNEDVLETRATNLWPYGVGVTELSGSFRSGDNYRVGGRVIQEIVPRQYAGTQLGLGGSLGGSEGAAALQEHPRRRSEEAGRRASPTCVAGSGIVDHRFQTQRDLGSASHEASGRSSSAGGAQSVFRAAGSEQATCIPPRSGSAPSLGATGLELRRGRAFARESRFGRPAPLPQWNI
ncbi:unnamed protein product [Prorocentrum cordatum]|uniref:Uncharacterized protein n=1 Tax=Prorocentrum cordatum TaxID=2364126 RepID=A0ABN9Y594_9DINO|nr:unnamed protein product [Polarella glacialis]